ncbi:MAG: adenosylcobinamide amidohydrolase [Desulfohalobiaceae bacterium]|nr:adenosylcobinamide amidohydrolase [Desulfohalobiaceae bacterium]
MTPTEKCPYVFFSQGLQGVRSRVFATIGLSEKDSSFLFTGADMDNLSVQEETYQDMHVYALVTAGVRSNAVRMSRDEGRFYEPGTGTINILIMSNMRLSPRAMTRAIISATEAKTAALLDMDVRSAYSPLQYRATGTGTDNVLVVEGAGRLLNNAGGHSKLGELIAKAVYAGVQEAIYKQNSLSTKRNVFQRLKDRKISLHSLVSEINCQCSPQSKNNLIAGVEEALLDPTYSNFLEAALTISDDHQKDLVTDLSAFKLWCKEIAADLAGKPVNKMQDLVKKENLPQVQEIAFNALFNGILLQEQK